MFCANHGLALVVTAHRGAQSHTILFDGGLAEAAFAENARLLGIDLGRVEAMMLSYGHWDHAGGLLRALDLVQTSRRGRPIPLYMHPGMFDERSAPFPGGLRMPFRNVPMPEAFAARGAFPCGRDSLPRSRSRAGFRR